MVYVTLDLEEISCEDKPKGKFTSIQFTILYHITGFHEE